MLLYIIIIIVIITVVIIIIIIIIICLLFWFWLITSRVVHLQAHRIQVECWYFRINFLFYNKTVMSGRKNLNAQDSQWVVSDDVLLWMWADFTVMK